MNYSRRKIIWEVEVFVERYKAKNAINRIANMIGDINSAIVNKIALPAKRTVIERNTFLESSGLAKRSATSTTAGLRNKIAGFQ